MISLRSLVCWMLFIPWTVAVGSTLPFLMLLPFSLTLRMARLWTRGVFWQLRYICRITYEVQGLEFLPKDGPAIIASKHQSPWETLIFLLYLRHPAYVLKRELLRVPFFGQFVWRLDMIAINRSDPKASLKQLIQRTRDITGQGRQVIIFPEGTRTRPGSAPDYKKGGISSLYRDLPQVPVIPVALNSGLFWRKGDWRKYPGHIVMRILPPLPPGLPTKEFMAELQEVIERHSNALLPSESVLT